MIAGRQGFSEQVAIPEESIVTRGVVVGGTLPDLLDSDDGYVEIQARRPTEVAAASVEIEVTATATTDMPSVLEFTVEAASSGAPARQRIEMFNYDSGVWEQVDEREAPMTDTVVTVSISENAPRFVDPQTLEVKTRIGYVDLGITFPSWGGRFDQVFWTVVAQ